MSFSPALSAIESSAHSNANAGPGISGTTHSTATLASTGSGVMLRGPNAFPAEDSSAQHAYGLEENLDAVGDVSGGAAHRPPASLPDSPHSSHSGVAFSSGGGSGHWGADGTEGGMGQGSPSRARAREARLNLIREAVGNLGEEGLEGLGVRSELAVIWWGLGSGIGRSCPLLVCGALLGFLPLRPRFGSVRFVRVRRDPLRRASSRSLSLPLFRVGLYGMVTWHHVAVRYAILYYATPCYVMLCFLSYCVMHHSRHQKNPECMEKCIEIH